MLAFTTDTRDQRPGWDAFDRMVLWAVAARPRQTLDDIAALLPAGVAYHLIRSALDTTVGEGLVVRTVADEPTYRVTPSGQYRLAGTSSPGHQAAA